METILVGSALAVRDALATLNASPRAKARVCGAVLIGNAGDCSTAGVTAHAQSWEALDFGAITTSNILLAESLTPSLTNQLVTRAADRGKRLHVMDGGAPRRLCLDDLIGRPLGALDWRRIAAAITGRRVLITGGGGSIGSELARKIAALAPARLTLLDSSEFNLFKISLELKEATPVLADIRDWSAMRRWLERERPEIVFHAAALKQVPMVEAFPSEGVLTNVCGLRHVAEAAQMVGADLVFVSTDKAVEPSGVMGATKRLGELYCRALDRRGPRRAIPIRLGNVIGSAGSVAPLFEEQIESGGPLTVTDPQMTRFFMSIPQAAKALLLAGAAGLDEKAARGAVLSIDMGEAVPVVELAHKMIRLAGLRPDIDVPIEFTGLRPGERLHEQLIAADEWLDDSTAQGVLAAAASPHDLVDLLDCMDCLERLAREGADAAVAAELFRVTGPAPVAPAAARNARTSRLLVQSAPEAQ